MSSLSAIGPAIGAACVATVAGLTACGSAERSGSTVEYEYLGRESDDAAPIAGCARFRPLVEQAGDAHGVDPGLIAGIATVESRWRPEVVSRAGARGLMQIMPSTGRRLGCGSLLSPRDNLECGARLLARLLRRYDGAVDYALAAYAVGAQRPDRAFAERSEPPRQPFIRRVLAARKRWLERGCT